MVDAPTIAHKRLVLKKYFANFRKSLGSRAFRTEVFFGEYAARQLRQVGECPSDQVARG